MLNIPYLCAIAMLLWYGPICLLFVSKRKDSNTLWQIGSLASFGPNKQYTNHRELTGNQQYPITPEPLQYWISPRKSIRKLKIIYPMNIFPPVTRDADHVDILNSILFCSGCVKFEPIVQEETNLNSVGGTSRIMLQWRQYIQVINQLTHRGEN